MATDSIINLVLFGVLFFTTVIGFAKGFIEQAIELIGTIASFVLAVMLAGAVANFLQVRFDASYSVWLVVGFIALLIAGLSVTRLIAVGFGKAIKMTILKTIDRLTGAGLGLVMGMLIASLLITLTLEVPLSRSFRKDVATSSMGLFLRPIAGQVFNWIVVRTFKSNHFEDFFKRSNTV